MNISINIKYRTCIEDRVVGNPLPVVIGNVFVKMLESAQRVKVRIAF